jgi:hypothetical protein
MVIGVGYTWLQIAAFVRQEKDTQFILFLNCPPETRDRILDNRYAFSPSAGSRSDPFAWHSLLIDELRAVYDGAVWRMRDLVRAVEKVKPLSSLARVRWVLIYNPGSRKGLWNTVLRHRTLALQS